jgi:hypothetical protein
MDQHMKTRKLIQMMVSKTFNTITAEFGKKDPEEETVLLQFRKLECLGTKSEEIETKTLEILMKVKKHTMQNMS